MKKYVLILLILAAVVSGCAKTTADSEEPQPAKLTHVGGSPILSVVLTQQGMQRIGIQTGTVSSLAHPRPKPPTGPRLVLPYSAVVYQANGTPVVYTNPAPRVFTRATISIDHISGNRVSVKTGPAVGTKVVTVGAQELLGVQNGVGVE
jgi:hypothetical protein